jgi:hypothetical protein
MFSMTWQPTAFVFMLLALATRWCTAQTISLEAPLDRQVFQRDAHNGAEVRLVGTAAADAGMVEAQATLSDGLRGQAVGWQVIARGRQLCNGRFNGGLRLAAGGWYALHVRCRRSVADQEILGEAMIEHVGVGDVFVVAGQSNAANGGEERQKTKTGLVANFNGTKWQVADDPQPGADCEGGSFIPTFGDALAERFRIPIGVITCGLGGTSVREWLPEGVTFPTAPTIKSRVRQLSGDTWASNGDAFNMLVGRMKQLGSNGFRAVLWHQGEADAYDRLSGDLYSQYLAQIMTESRKQTGLDAPWFVAQVSYLSPAAPSATAIRAGQRSLWDRKIALEGPDSDALIGGLRSENGQGIHFSGKGLREHGSRWADKVGAWLMKQTVNGDEKEIR